MCGIILKLLFKISTTKPYTRIGTPTILVIVLEKNNHRAETRLVADQILACANRSHSFSPFSTIIESSASDASPPSPFQVLAD